ncbi:uncharacterized protein LOC144200980 [Stigmatopora nigra]
MDPYAAYHRLARDPPRQYQGPPPGFAHGVKAEETPLPGEPHRIPRPLSSSSAAATATTAYGPPREVPDSEAPPNVTVSTSTIPLSMAAPRRRRADDLSAIVHQINRLCRARAGAGATSVCEGQIANPGPISRNLLIDASSRAAAATGGGRSAAPPVVLPAARVQRRRAWAGGAEDEGAPPCKDPRPAECALLGRTPSYPCKPAEAPHAHPDYGPPPRARFPLEAAGAEYRRPAAPADFPRGRHTFPHAGPRGGAGRPPDGACALYPAYR